MIPGVGEVPGRTVVAADVVNGVCVTGTVGRCVVMVGTSVGDTTSKTS